MAELSGSRLPVPHADSDLKDAGELTALYVEPQYWSRGVGASLIAATRLRLKNQGFQRACLWLLDGNVRGDRLYQRDGWAPDGYKCIGERCQAPARTVRQAAYRSTHLGRSTSSSVLRTSALDST